MSTGIAFVKAASLWNSTLRSLTNLTTTQLTGIYALPHPLLITVTVDDDVAAALLCELSRHCANLMIEVWRDIGNIYTVLAHSLLIYVISFQFLTFR